MSEATRGRKFSDDHLARLSAAGKRRFARERPLGERAPRWRGADAAYNTIHAWLAKHYPKSGICERCGADVGAKGQRGTHYAFRFHGKRPYSRDRSDYRELCPACHNAVDKRGAE